jgi:hypothetical protein
VIKFVSDLQQRTDNSQKKTDIETKQQSIKQYTENLQESSQKRHFQQYFSYIMATIFSGGRSQSTRKEPPTMSKEDDKLQKSTGVCYQPYWDDSCD